MFVSLQTYHGMQIIARSTVEVVKLLLQITCKFILTKRLCSDLVEEYFMVFKGNQGEEMTALIWQNFGSNDNTIRIQRDVSFTSGNMKGKYNERTPWIKVSDETVPKRNIELKVD